MEQPLIQDTLNGGCGRKILTTVSFLIGLSFAALILSVVRDEHDQMVQEPITALAVPHMQTLRAAQFMQPVHAKAWPSRRPDKFAAALPGRNSQSWPAEPA